MAPMAGITTPAFRRSVRRWGAGLVVHGDDLGLRRRTTATGAPWTTWRARADEHPLGFQLFGADAGGARRRGGARAWRPAPTSWTSTWRARCARSSRPAPARRCWATPDRAAAIVAAVVGRRRGPRPGDGQDPFRAARGRRGGAPRGAPPRRRGRRRRLHPPATARQLYRGRADHAVTFALAAELPVPVIASGDVDGRAAALALLEGGAAAVMLARHALGRPWLFAEILDDAPPPLPTSALAEVRRFAGESWRAWARAPSAICASSGRGSGAPVCSTRSLPTALMLARRRGGRARPARHVTAGRSPAPHVCACAES